MIRGKQRRYAGQALRRKADIGPGGDNRITSRTPLVPEVGAPAASVVTITFDQPVVLTGFPAVFDASTPSITVNAATRPTPNTVVLTFNAAPTVAITWPFEDPAVRNQAGGYVQAGTYLF
jgi:hypothetical protein